MLNRNLKQFWKSDINNKEFLKEFLENLESGKPYCDVYTAEKIL